MAKRIIAADCETDPFKRRRIPKPFIWGAYDGSGFWTFDSTEEFVEWAREQDALIYAHNGGRFDWHFLLPWLTPYDPVMLINGRIAKVSLGLAELRDSYNLIPVPLAAYKKDDIDYAIMEEGQREKAGNRRKIRQYLKSDCVYLWELIDEFQRRFGLHLTQAGAAMKQWGRMCPAGAPKTGKGFYDEFAPYYYGGRVECFRSGIVDGQYSCFDINSAYPRAMLERHPYSENFSSRKGFAKGADFYRVVCESSGAFPFRGIAVNEHAAGLSFPQDGALREFTITSWELEAAEETGHFRKAKVLESLTFVSHETMAPYVEKFWAMREECKRANDEAGSLFAKLLMNSLYGKFAANPENYYDSMIVPMDVICGLEKVGWRYAGELGPWGLAEKDMPEYKQRYYNVATGASITGYVRAMLWRAIAGSEDVAYCDTDSLVCGKPGPSIVEGPELGQWKHEGDFDRLGIGGKKVYIMRGAPGWWTTKEGKTVYAEKKPHGAERLMKTASKGTRLTERQLWKVAKGERVVYESEAPTFSAKRGVSFVRRYVVNTA